MNWLGTWDNIRSNQTIHRTMFDVCMHEVKHKYAFCYNDHHGPQKPEKQTMELHEWSSEWTGVSLARFTSSVECPSRSSPTTCRPLMGTKQSEIFHTLAMFLHVTEFRMHGISFVFVLDRYKPVDIAQTFIHSNACVHLHRRILILLFLCW